MDCFCAGLIGFKCGTLNSQKHMHIYLFRNLLIKPKNKFQVAANGNLLFKPIGIYFSNSWEAHPKLICYTLCCQMTWVISCYSNPKYLISLLINMDRVASSHSLASGHISPKVKLTSKSTSLARIHDIMSAEPAPTLSLTQLFSKSDER